MSILRVPGKKKHAPQQQNEAHALVDAPHILGKKKKSKKNMRYMSWWADRVFVGGKLFSKKDPAKQPCITNYDLLRVSGSDHMPVAAVVEIPVEV
jgi:hypothetical protein